MMGVGAGSASYYAGRDVPTFSNTASAFGWLMEVPSRRWLVIRSNDLPQMNSMYRGRVTPPENLPVLDARSSEILLVSNRLENGESNQNPFRDWILTAAPVPSRPVDGNFGNQLDAIGWDVKTRDGKVVDAVVAGEAVPVRPLLQGHELGFRDLGDVHPHRRLPAPLQRRSQDARRQVPVPPVAGRRLHRRHLRVLAGAELHSGRVPRLLRALHGRPSSRSETWPRTTKIDSMPGCCAYARAIWQRFAQDWGAIVPVPKACA